ncbi:MAG: Rubredoxin-NAD(+) reductase [marine bacterium B5-7]|nr:MAG: Rubredoxin-NAD(+) reductase [marine bacterium B5-7]
MAEQQTLVIIGSGLAGYSVAREVRKRDKDIPITIITASDGTFYSKPQLSTAFANNKTAEQIALSDAEKMASQFNATIITHAQVQQLDIESQCIHYLDENQKKQSCYYQDCVLATGANPKQLPWHSHTISVNQHHDYQYFRDQLQDVKHITIIGSGLVGCEFANDLHLAGFDIKVISMDATPLAQLLPPSLGTQFAAACAQQGIQWQFSSAVDNISPRDNGYEIHCALQTAIQTDLVLSAVGLTPNIELASAAGITCQQGIVVNTQLETSAPHVYALGDCAEMHEQLRMYVMPTNVCAKALAATLTGEPTAVTWPLMPIVIKTPFCPVCILHPPSTGGTWSTSGKAHHAQFLHTNAEGKLDGFILMGDTVKTRATLMQQMR